MIHSICELVDDMGITHDSDEAQGYKELKDDWESVSYTHLDVYKRQL